jgi:hypothetical protein
MKGLLVLVLVADEIQSNDTSYLADGIADERIEQML